jgi:hypothetical protein
VGVRVVAPNEDQAYGGRAVDTASRRPYFLAVSVQAMDGDDAVIGLAANAQLSSKKHTELSGWCFLLTTSRSCATAAAGSADADDFEWETEVCLRNALLRADAKEASYRKASGQTQKVFGVRRSQAELHSGCWRVAGCPLSSPLSPRTLPSPHTSA